MTSHKNAGGIRIFWLIFGSNGHITKPDGGVLESYTRCATREYPSSTKAICDPLKILGCNAHSPYYVRGYESLNENGETFPPNITPRTTYDKYLDSVFDANDRNECYRH